MVLPRWHSFEFDETVFPLVGETLLLSEVFSTVV